MSTLSRYRAELHPITGMSTGRLAMWLFLGSEVMLFGALISTYLMLRLGAPGYWPHHALSIPIGAWNTLLLVAACGLTIRATQALRRENIAGYRRFLSWSTALGTLFLIVKIAEWFSDLGKHLTPAVNNFYALYYLMTGIFCFHLIAALGANAYFHSTSAKAWGERSALLSERAANAGLYWQFLTGVWAVLFIVLYLL